jgi:hypothetical protein
MSEETSSTYGVPIPIPIADVNTVPEPIEPVKMAHRWLSKKSKIIFRGSISSFDRIQLLLSVNGLPEREKSWFDVSLTGVSSGAPCENNREAWCPDGPTNWLRQTGLKIRGKGDMMSLYDQVNNYKYILSVDGVGCAYRLRNLLCSSSVVVKQDSSYKEFWYDDIQHQREFIQLTHNFVDLSTTIGILSKASHEHHLSIINHANSYCKKFLNEVAMSYYIVSLIKAYSLKTSCDTCDLPQGAQPWKLWFQHFKST